MLLSSIRSGSHPYLATAAVCPRTGNKRTQTLIMLTRSQIGTILKCRKIILRFFIFEKLEDFDNRYNGWRMRDWKDKNQRFYGPAKTRNDAFSGSFQCWLCYDAVQL